LEDLEVEDDAIELLEDRNSSLANYVDYMASFTFSQIALSVTEVGLNGVSSLLNSGAQGTSNLARTTRTVRRRGAKANPGVANSILSVANFTGVNFILGLAGLRLGARTKGNVKNVEKALPTDEDLIQHAEGTKMLSDEMLDNYFSGDSDFVPEEGESDSESSSESSASSDEEVVDNLTPVVVRVEMTGEERLEDLGEENREVIFEEGHCLPMKIKEEPMDDVVYEEGYCLPKTTAIKEERVDVPVAEADELPVAEAVQDSVFSQIIDEAKEFVGKIVSESLDESMK